MNTGRQRFGRESERLACEYLQSRGYVIEARNVRYPSGEIDVVATDGPALCFIEVRSTTSDAWGGPLSSVNARKCRQIISAARWFVASRRPSASQIRFDVVGISGPAGHAPRIELIQGAFDATGMF